jgi:MFS family permease
VQSATEKVKIYEDWEEVPGGKALPQLPENLGLLASIKELGVWGTTKGGWKSMLACYPQILMCVFNPLIFWVSILNAVAFGGMLSIAMTYATVLAAPPYFLPVDAIALVNTSAAVGSLLAWPASGIMIARISRRLSIRNGGVRHAEYYLPAFVLPILSAAASVILYGLAGERKWHWIWIYVSYMLNSFSFVGLATANTLWVTEAFPRWAAAVLAIVGGGSYVISFSISFAILPWIKSQGFALANIEIGVLTLVVGLVLIPVAFWGESLRQYIHGRWAMNEGGALRPQ